MTKNENELTMKDMGRLMKSFNENHPGQDGKIVSQEIRSLITS